MKFIAILTVGLLFAGCGSSTTAPKLPNCDDKEVQELAIADMKSSLIEHFGEKSRSTFEPAPARLADITTHSRDEESLSAVCKADYYMSVDGLENKKAITYKLSLIDKNLEVKVER